MFVKNPTATCNGQITHLKQVYQFTILHSLFAFSVDQCERTLIAECLLIMQEVGCSISHDAVLQVWHSEVNTGIMIRKRVIMQMIQDVPGL